MNLRFLFLAAALVFVIGGAGYLVGSFLQAPEEFLAASLRPPPDSQPAPILLAPAPDSEFVDSDISLSWSWSPDLADNQVYALRMWVEGRPPHEVWTVDSRVPVDEIVDSFSLDFGKFYWQVGVVNLSDEGRYEAMGSDWSEISQLQRLRRPRLPIKA